MRTTVGGVVVLASLSLLALSVAPTGMRAGATSPHAPGTVIHASLVDDTCPNLANTTYAVSGTVTLPGATMPTSFSAIYSILSDGTTVKATSSFLVPDLSYGGSVHCDTASGTNTITVANNPTVVAGTTVGSGEITGNSNFTEDSQGVLHSVGGTATANPPLFGINQSFTGAVNAIGSPMPAMSITGATAIPASPGPVTYTVTVPQPATVPEVPTGTVTVDDGQGGSCSDVTLPASGSVDCTVTENSAPGCPYTITASYSGDANYAPADAAPMVRASGAAIAGSAAATLGCTITATDGAKATAFGGSGLDTISGAQYGSDPVGNLESGTDTNANYYDVELSPGNTFTSVLLHSCTGVSAQTVLQWWNGSVWQPIKSPATSTASTATPPYGQSYANGCISVTIDANSSPSLSDLTGTVIATSSGRAITSSAGISATSGSPLSLAVTTIGTPVSSIRSKGKLPKGVRLVDHHNGSATVVGTPKAGGIFQPTITATYGAGKAKQRVSQVLTIVVFQTPTFARKASATTHVGSVLRVTTSVKAFPPAVLSESGALPTGITFTAGANGSATLRGVAHPGTAGVYPLILSASTGGGSPVTKSFTLTVKNS